MSNTPAKTGLRPIFSAEQIAAAVRRIGKELTSDYAGGQPHLLVVLKGAFVFAADLARCIELPVTMDFIRISSYCGTLSSGSVHLALPHETNLRDKDILIVEDILDTGLSLRYLVSSLAAQQPRSIKTCVLITKQLPGTVVIEPDYHGFYWDGGFLAGYGLDDNELLRNLPEIYELS